MHLRNLPTAIELGLQVMAIARAIQQAKAATSPGGTVVTITERVEIYRLVGRLLIKAGADPADVLPDGLLASALAFSNELDQSFERLIADPIGLLNSDGLHLSIQPTEG